MPTCLPISTTEPSFSVSRIPIRRALCGAVEKAMDEQAGEKPLRREGYRDGTWVLLDYGCVVVHVFSAEAREFYSLERLWHDGKPLDLSSILTAD